MEHTKGPWRAAGQGNGKGELSILGPDGEIACIRNKAHLGDARLIAAAPDLLELAKRACFLQEQSETPDKYFTVLRLKLAELLPRQTVDESAVKQAIAKATD